MFPCNLGIFLGGKKIESLSLRSTSLSLFSQQNWGCITKIPPMKIKGII